MWHRLPHALLTLSTLISALYALMSLISSLIFSYYDFSFQLYPLSSLSFMPNVLNCTVFSAFSFLIYIHSSLISNL